METEKVWSGEFGDSYHKRNRVEWRKRIKFWSEILDLTGARSVYEWGCGPGWNLSAIKSAADWDEPPWCRWSPTVQGQEINEDAQAQASSAGLAVWDTDDYFLYEQYELTFTCGALIHVPPEYLKDRMQWMIDRSCDYVLAIEYENPTEKMIPYRGQDNLLWARPYGKLYQKMGLKMVATGGAGDGFDDCTFWLLRK